jgi:4-alpha-glucanotransferase
MKIIAEDLGFLDAGVKNLLELTGLPGMDIWQFTSDEMMEMKPEKAANRAFYTGTHDNDTIMGWIKNLDNSKKLFLNQYLNINDEKQIYWSIIKSAFATNSDTVIIPIQDYLGLDSCARINTPSTLGKNWQWRIDKKLLTDELAEKIYNLTALYGRIII